MKYQGKNSILSKSKAPVLCGEVRILGIDPGSITGYGIIDTNFNQKQTIIKTSGLKGIQNSNKLQRMPNDCIYVASGSIDLSFKKPFHLRLKNLYNSLIDIIKEYSPHEVVVEKVFFSKSVKSALNLGQIRGVVLLAASSQNLNIYEYSALEVKKAITGYGRAEKRQVQEMVKRILFPNFNTHVLSFVLNEDASDALALTICHMNTIRLEKAYKMASMQYK
ncbi:MAG: crossover junction endodeoxyribonuclease RuvC [Nitrospirae bacterium]|nr:crossover junction endodeoxyribonuclease RuvC [Nitrospirota bacterium]